MKSLKELYRIGVGPSSSHSMAPAKASLLFKERYPETERFEVRLFGTLAATGRGHFTDRAIEQALAPIPVKIHWQPEITLARHPNAMEIQAYSSDDHLLGETLFYSTGGGAVSEEGQTGEPEDCYPFDTMQDLMNHCRQEGVPLHSIVWQFDHADIREHLEQCRQQMSATIKNGIATEGVLPGGLRLPRKARNFFLKAQNLRRPMRRTGLLSAYAYASAEENAALGTVVTAPTCGSCGVLPAILRYCSETMGLTAGEQLNAMACAGLVGNVIKRNASISGAEVGCQGEIGSACAMAAAAAAAIFGGTIPQIEYAAEIGLEHFLGLTCDPVMGLVQIPCIERNALAANKAVIAAEYALLSDGRHRVSFDDVVTAMKRTGHDLPALYRETSAGGLAAIVSR